MQRRAVLGVDFESEGIGIGEVKASCHIGYCLFPRNGKEALTMGTSYREELIEAIRELLPAQFFRSGPPAAARNGRPSGPS
jgi:hypothetical protein